MPGFPSCEVPSAVSGSSSTCPSNGVFYFSLTSISEGSELLVVLPDLGCCSFLLTLITRHGSTESHCKRSAIF